MRIPLLEEMGLSEEITYENPKEFKNHISGLGEGWPNCTFGLLAITFNILLQTFLTPEVDYLIWIILNIFAAIIFHRLLLYRKRRRFKNPIESYELETLLTKAKDRLEMSRKVELWSIDDESFVHAIASNLLL